jgi:hypothetical protein
MQITEVVTLLATILAAGWFAAVVVQFLKRTQWPSSVKLALAVVVSAIVGLAAAWLSGDVTRFVTIWKAGTVTANQVVAFAVLIFVAAQTWYHRYFKEQGWAQTLGAIGSR